MATAHLIHGYIGAGKTTFALRLERDLCAIRFSHDEWVTALYGNDPPADLFSEYARRVTSVIWTLWPRCLVLGQDVILDLNFWSRVQRDEARRTAVENGGTYRLYRLHCAEETAWARVSDRNTRSNDCLYIARNTFELLKQRYEPLDADEEHIDVLT
jgi:predicted kinase